MADDLLAVRIRRESNVLAKMFNIPSRKLDSYLNSYLCYLKETLPARVVYYENKITNSRYFWRIHSIARRYHVIDLRAIEGARPLTEHEAEYWVRVAVDKELMDEMYRWLTSLGMTFYHEVDESLSPPSD